VAQSKRCDQMLHFVLSLRWITLLAALGAAVGSVLMFIEGGVKLGHALEFAFLSTEPAVPSVIALVMQATDAFLFGLVLIVFAYAITFGFAFDLPETARAKLPQWMRVDGISELKITLIEVTLVYLVVDFATDMVEVETHVTWDMALKPVSILLIAGALRLVEIGRPNYHTTFGAQHPPTLDKSTSGERLAVAADLNLRSIQPSKRRYPKPHV
jgi:uncharacterized membrane protein YqhA